MTAKTWLHLAVAPLATAARLELRHPPGDTAPIAALDVQAAFMQTLPCSGCRANSPAPARSRSSSRTA